MVPGRVAPPDTTETYPRDQRGYQSLPDLITALGIMGTGIALPMLAGQESFTLGRADACHLRADEQYLAPVHARLERIVGGRGSLRVTNVSSGKNHIVYNGELAESQFMMRAGEWFEIGDSRYYALNEEMQLERPAVMEVLGIRNHRAVDDFLIAAVKDSARHVLLLGEPRSGQERLGRAIHHISHRRHKRFLALPAKPKLDSSTRQDLCDARSGTVLVYLHHKGKLNERFVAALACRAARLRLIICARSRDKIEASFPARLVNEAMQITIQPLRERAGEIAELLDQWFIEDASPLRFTALREELRESLLSDPWPDNFDGLKEAADHLIQLAPCRSGRQAAQGSRFTRSALRSWTQKRNIRLKFPLVPDDTNQT